MSAKYTQLLKGTGTHKYKMLFFDASRKKIKSVQFGAVGYESYPDHQDLQRKMSYISRHKTNEDWQNPMTSGALSKWILWNKTSLNTSYKDFMNHFGFKPY
jgi:hypothetical protein